MQVTVITSFNKSGYDSYGQRCVETFDRFWPQNYKLRVYVEGMQLPQTSARIEQVDLLQASPELVAFKAEYGNQPLCCGKTPKGYTYLFDAVKFSHKAFAIAHAAETVESRYLVWLDADIVTNRDVPENLVEDLLRDNVFVAYLARFGVYTETGFIAFDLEHPGASYFFSLYKQIYSSGEIFTLREWHDCEVFDVARVATTALGLVNSRSINTKTNTMDPFDHSVLSEYMHHLKGGIRKVTGDANPEGTYGQIALPPVPANLKVGRYAQIAKLISIAKPRSIVEIGTWSGHRALSMAEEALKYTDTLVYHGFDLFETATPDDDEYEKNVKKHYTSQQVAHLLHNYSLKHPGFTAKLTKGNTTEVLPDMAVDFAYIDGGHSVETIRSDYEHLKRSRVVLFDDYYEGGIDITQFGCNEIVKDIPHLVLPIGDPVTGGGITKFVVVSDPLTLAMIQRALIG